MINKKIKFVLIACLLAVIIFPAIALADTALGKLEEVGSTNGPYEGSAGEYGVAQIVGVGIEAVLALIGAIFLVLIIYAGYHWMTARGEEEKVEKAKDTLNRAIIGLIIVIGAYAIWSFIFNSLF